MTDQLPTKTKSPLTSKQPGTEVAEFLAQLRAKSASGPIAGRGRLIIALDATASREPTWDQACELQGEMFEATAGLGGIEIKLAFYRGFNECKSSRWHRTAVALHNAMRSVSCAGGHTQIRKILKLALDEAEQQPISALVFIGDCMEEVADELCHLAGELGQRGVPIFLFHEGRELVAEACFKQMARLSRGQYLAFDLASISRLRELLATIAVYATGNQQALLEYGRQKGGEVLRLTSRLGRGS